MEIETVLDYQGCLIYLIPNFLTTEEHNFLLKECQNCNSEQHKIKVYGKEYNQPRLVKWFSTNEKYKYSYSNLTLGPSVFPEKINELRENLEVLLDYKFPTCLLNHYRNGDDYVSYHSDDEKELGSNPIIASIWIGTKRKFNLKNKLNKRQFSIFLNPGSLLVMAGETQNKWAHSIPKEKETIKERYNLTFRPYYENN